MKRLSLVIIFPCVLAVCLSVLPASVAAKNNPARASAKDIEQAFTLQTREQTVSMKEEELERQQQELTALQEELNEKLTRLATLQENVTEQLGQLQVIQGKRFKNLISVYSSMSATKVAPLLNSMEDGTVSQILQAMKTDQVAKIMPKLEPEKAVRVSKRLGLLR
jgi:flagellar motility protein MotE (MotC chaperone)